MSQDQEFMQVMAFVSQECMTALTRAVEQKKILTNIIIDEISNQEKLQKIRQSILKYNAFCQEEKTAPQFPSLKQGDGDVLKLTLLADLIENFNNNMKPYMTLFDNVSKVMRQEEFSTEKKVDAIGDLLM